QQATTQQRLKGPAQSRPLQTAGRPPVRSDSPPAVRQRSTATGPRAHCQCPPARPVSAHPEAQAA
ncbi:MULTISPECIES: hypothetical protein, partial [Phocaeicola]